MQAQVISGCGMNIALLVLQVSDAFTNDDIITKQAPACKHTGGLRLLSSGRELVPALGLAWANCVNTRLFLSRTEAAVTSPQCQSNNAAFSAPEQAYSMPIRYMQVVFSPCLPPDTCLFVVTQHGLQGVDNSKIIQERQNHTHHRYVDKRMVRHPLAAQQPGLQPSGGGGDAMPQGVAEAVPQQGTTLATGVFAAHC